MSLGLIVQVIWPPPKKNPFRNMVWVIICKQHNLHWMHHPLASIHPTMPAKLSHSAVWLETAEGMCILIGQYLDKMIATYSRMSVWGSQFRQYSRGGFCVWNDWSQWPSFQQRHSEPLYSLQHKFGLMIYSIASNPGPGAVGGALWWSHLLIKMRDGKAKTFWCAYQCNAHCPQYELCWD